jgi:hypothetical protein
MPNLNILDPETTDLLNRLILKTDRHRQIGEETLTVTQQILELLNILDQPHNGGVTLIQRIAQELELMREAIESSTRELRQGQLEIVAHIDKRNNGLRQELALIRRQNAVLLEAMRLMMDDLGLAPAAGERG